MKLKEILNESTGKWTSIPIKKICSEMDSCKFDVKKRQKVIDKYFKSFIGNDVQFKLDGHIIDTYNLKSVRPYFSNNKIFDDWNSLLGLPYVIGFIFDHSKSSTSSIIAYQSNKLELL